MPKRLFVAIPAYDRKICCETATALLNEKEAAAMCGIVLNIAFIPGCSLITHARNQAVQEFLESDCDRLIFIDSDVSWSPGMLLKLATHDVDFVGGAYRYKDDNEGYPVTWMPNKELWADEKTGLLEVFALPGGFLSLSRAVFSKLKEAHPEREYQFHGKTYRAYFHCPPGTGEDGAFCMDGRATGEKAWLDPNLDLSHVEGGKKYEGNIGKWLKSR